MIPRILITMHYMDLGGAEAALIGLLSTLDTRRVEVDLFLYDHRGELMSAIPPTVHLLPAIPAYTMLERPIMELVRRDYWRLAFARLWAKCVTRFAMHKNREHRDDASCFFNMSRYTTTILPAIQPDVVYNLAISFLAPHHIVLSKVRAKKKVAWIHTDYTHVYVDIEKETAIWSRYDSIAAVSDETRKRFIHVFPTLASKVFVCENILPVALIRKQAEVFVPTDMPRFEQEICLLSIGRYSNPKRFDEVPDICKQLVQLLPEHTIRWYIIGYGTDETLIRQRIQEAGMSEQVILLGKRANPYPYIKACDIYVQPSRYEGKSITVREAQILCKPVVITAYPTAGSQVTDGVDGVIVPMPVKECAEGIVRIIRNASIRQQLTTYLQGHDYSHAAEIEKIYKLL